MKAFDTSFFARYVNNDDTIIDIFHRHVLVVVWDIILWLAMGAVVPTYLYRWFFVLRPDLLWFDIPLWVMSAYLGVIWVIIMLKFFDWYNDVWIVTDTGIVDLNWSPFIKNTSYTEYDDITGIESRELNWFDSIFRMWDLIIHKIGADLRITRLARPNVAVAKIQSMKEEASGEPIMQAQSASGDVHVYFDGAKQKVHVDKNGVYSSQHEHDTEENIYVEKVKQKWDTIDLSQS